MVALPGSGWVQAVAIADGFRAPEVLTNTSTSSPDGSKASVMTVACDCFVNVIGDPMTVERIGVMRLKGVETETW